MTTFTKESLAELTKLIKAGNYHVQSMYIKHGAIRGEALVGVQQDPINIYFEFDLPEPADATVHIETLMKHIQKDWNDRLLHFLHIIAFIDQEEGAPTPLALELPDLARPYLEQMLPPTPAAK